MKKKIIILIGVLFISALYLSQTTPVRTIASSLNEPPQELTPLKRLKIRIIESIKVDVKEGTAHIQIGAPTLESGNFLCLEYPTFDLIFQVEGISVSGDRPALIVRVPCEMDANQRQTANIELDVEALLSDEDMKSTEISTFKQHWIPGLEHETWMLTDLQLHHQNRLSILQISNYEILSVWHEGFTLRKP